MEVFETCVHFARWMAKWKSIPIPEWIRGAKELRAGNFVPAASMYEAGLLRRPKHPARFAAKLDLSVCYGRSGRYAEAVAILEELRHHEAYGAEAKRRLIRLRLWLGHSVQAIELLEGLGYRNEGDDELLPLYLLALLDTEAPFEEIAKVAARVKRSPVGKTDLAKVGLARFDFKYGSLRRARTILTRFTQKDKGPREAFTVLGELLLKEGNPLYARHVFRRALSISPEHPRTWSLLAQSYLRPGPGYSERFALNAALNGCKWSQWESPRELMVLSEAYNHAGREEEAALVGAKARTQLLKEEALTQYRQDVGIAIEEVVRGTAY